MIANVLGVTLDMLVCDSLDFVAVPYHKEFVDILSDSFCNLLLCQSCFLSVLSHPFAHFLIIYASHLHHPA